MPEERPNGGAGARNGVTFEGSRRGSKGGERGCSGMVVGEIADRWPDRILGEFGLGSGLMSL